MVQIVWTANAISELQSIYDFVASDSKKYADRLVDNIHSQTLPLEFFPLLGRVVPELKDITIRELIYGNYRIIYRFKNDDLIEIITIHHSSRMMRNNKNI